MIAFFIPGIPRPTQTGTVVRAGGRAYPVRRNSEWSSYCALVASQHRPAEPLDGALTCALTFHLPRLASGKRALPIKRPDLDNLAKKLLDTFSGIIWHDDAQVVNLNLRKRYADRPGLMVQVRPFDPSRKEDT